MELDEGELSRRGALAIAALLSTGVLVSVGGLLVPSEVAAQAKKSAKPKTGKGQEKAEQGEEVSATEDLMREHGVLRRTLIVYGETARTLRSKPETVDPSALVDGCGFEDEIVVHHLHHVSPLVSLC